MFARPSGPLPIDSGIGAGTLVQLPPEPAGAETALPDGGVEVRLGGPAAPALEAASFDANLAEHLAEGVLTGIAWDLIDGIEADQRSCEDHLEQSRRAIELLGLVHEDRSHPFKGACGAFHPVLLEAVLRFQANARGEMLPAAGPVRMQIVGDEGPDGDLEDRARRVQTFLNYYLTEVAEEYYPDFDQMLLRLPLEGCAFKKVYRDPLKRRPVAPFIRPDALIMSYTTTDLSSALRVTHVLTLGRADMIRMQLAGVYRRVDLVEPEDEPNAVQEQLDRTEGRSPERGEREAPYTVWECHTELDIPVPALRHKGPDGKPSGLPLPYIVSIDRDSRRILAIRRNWKPGDTDFRREEFFVQYPFLPGLGVYGLGYAHVLGGLARTVTTMMRQQVDATTLSLFPAGFRVKGMRLDSNFVPLEPTEFREIDTGGLPIRDALMPLPFAAPTPAHAAVMADLVQAAQRVGATADMNVGDGRQDAPVGTTLALQEQALKLESAILKRLHVAHRKELRLLAKLFAETPGAVYPYRVDGKPGQALAADFSDPADIVPVSDPNIPTQTQRLAQAQAQLSLSSQQPGLYDARALNVEIQRTMGTASQVIAKILPEPGKAQPLDPVSELQALVHGLPVQAFAGQDHASHVAFLMATAQDPQYQALVQQLGPKLSALLADHAAWQRRAEIEAAIGQPLPPPGATLPPAVAAQLAQAAAKAAAALAQARQQASGGAPGAGGPGDPNATLAAAAAADVQRKAEADRMADQTKRDIAADNNRTAIVTAVIRQSKPSDAAATEAAHVEADPPTHLQGDQSQGIGATAAPAVAPGQGIGA